MNSAQALRLVSPRLSSPLNPVFSHSHLSPRCQEEEARKKREKERRERKMQMQLSFFPFHSVFELSLLNLEAFQP